MPNMSDYVENKLLQKIGLYLTDRSAFEELNYAFFSISVGFTTDYCSK